MISILYVDDEPALLDIARLFLEKSGEMQVDTALSAADALQKLAGREYDIIISDYQMPDMDGIALLKVLKKNGNTTPFILYTGRGREEVVIEAINNGATFYLQKGGDPKSQYAELAHKIRLAAEKRRAERALQESEENYRHLFDEAADLIAIVDTSGTFLNLNRRFEEESGFERDEMLGRNVFLAGLLTKESGMKIAFHLGELLIGKVPPIFEIEGVNKNGIIVPYELRASAIRKDGKIVAIQAILRNLTERHKNEYALRESEERYRTVVETQKEFICRFLPDGTYIFVNDAFARYFGKDPGAIIGHRFKPFVPADERDPIRTHFASLTPQNADATMEHRIIMPDGGVRWQEWSDHAVFDSRGRIIEYQSVGRDITRRKEAEIALALRNQDLAGANKQLAEVEEELRSNLNDLVENRKCLEESEKLHRTIFETVPEGIALTDTQGTITYASPAALCLFGLNHPDDARGSSIFDWIAPEKQEETRARVLQFIASGSMPANASVFPVRKKDGTSFFAEISSAVLLDAGKKPRGMISILRDVTDRIAHQDALARATSKLNLLSAVTRHDILNRITVLMGYIELSRQANDPDTLRESLDKAAWIAGMLGQQIEFARDYQDLGVKTPEWQDLAAVCSRAASLLDMGQVNLINEAEGLEIYADPLLEKVVYNIIDNTLRHGSSVNTLRVHFRNENGEMTWVIEDDGKGIPVSNKAKIFNKGFGTHTGFGLFLAREILAITGMNIRETGFPGRGARFEITVPPGKFRIRSAR
ncbi:MAG: PAS domain S-box protein [Methanoregula sp.]